MTNSFDTWIAIVSVAVVLTGVFIAYRSSRIANTSLRLNEEKARARKPNLVADWTEGFVRKTPTGSGRIYAFSLLLSNRADTNNALASIELNIKFLRGDGTLGNRLLVHNEKLLEHLGLDSASPFDLPARLSSRDTITGWAIFELDDSFNRD